MKKNDLPQDNSKFGKLTRELCYVKNEAGEYVQALSSGWDIKTDALNEAWNEVQRRIEDARKAVANGSMSPVFYFMELNLMDLPTLAAYSGFWSFSVRRHFKPKVFNKLKDKKLAFYASAFKISIDELKNFNGKD